jgi:hypothetical protein
VSSLIEERLAVVDLFKEYPTLASALQSALKRMPDTERLLPRAARALQALLRRAGGGGGDAGGGRLGGEAAGPRVAEEGAGSQDAWLEAVGEGQLSDQWLQRQGSVPHPVATAAAKQGRQPAWRGLLQARQQQQQNHAQQQPQQSTRQHHVPARSAWGAAGGASAAGGVDADPADGAWAADARQSTWRAVRQLPAALSALVEAVAMLRRQMGQLGVSSSKLPLVHRAVVEAARCAGPVAEVSRLLEGAEWTQQAGGGESGASSFGEGGLRLAKGADEGCDEAAKELRAAEERLTSATREALTMFGGSAAGRQQQQHQQRVGGGQKRQQQKGKQQEAAAGASVVDVEGGLLQVR